MWLALANTLLNVALPVLSKVLTTLGLSMISYLVFNTLTQTAVTAVTANYSGMSVDVLQIVNLAGGGTGLSVLASALVTRASIMAVSKLGGHA